MPEEPGNGSTADPQQEQSTEQMQVGDDFAARLLLVQHRIEALDRLYNEEVVALQRNLTELQADYLRRIQAQRVKVSSRHLRHAAIKVVGAKTFASTKNREPKG